MAYARLDGGSSSEVEFDGFKEAALLAGDVDPELVLGRRVEAGAAMLRIALG